MCCNNISFKESVFVRIFIFEFCICWGGCDPLRPWHMRGTGLIISFVYWSCNSIHEHGVELKKRLKFSLVLSLSFFFPLFCRAETYFLLVSYLSVWLCSFHLWPGHYGHIVPARAQILSQYLHSSSGELCTNALLSFLFLAAYCFCPLFKELKSYLVGKVFSLYYSGIKTVPHKRLSTSLTGVP